MPIITLIAIGIIATAVYLTSPILTPFVIGTVMGYVLNPLVNYLTSKGVNRTFASLLPVVLVIGSLIFLIALAVPVVVADVKSFASHLPKYAELAKEQLPQWQAYVESNFGISLAVDDLIKEISNYGDKIAITSLQILQQMAVSTMALFDLVSLLLITPLVVFYFLLDWPKIIDSTTNLIPPAYRKNSLRIIKNVDTQLSAFLRGQFMVCLCLGIFYAVGLTLTGLEMGILIGFVTGLLSFIPFVGMALGLISAFIVAVLQYQLTSIEPYALVALVFIAGQVLEGFILTPKMVGEKVGLHPMWVIFAVMAGSQMGGFLGMLVALPLATVLTVLIPEGISFWHKQGLQTMSENSQVKTTNKRSKK